MVPHHTLQITLFERPLEKKKKKNFTNDDDIRLCGLDLSKKKKIMWLLTDDPTTF